MVVSLDASAFRLHHTIHLRPEMTSGRAGIVAAQNWALTAAQLATMAGGGWKRWNSEQNCH
jgi:hypothetical protein